ncbi:MAG: LptF/LptG family permease [Candidatus Margulisiibacteriota bacterium]
MKTLDRYLSREFLGPFFLGIFGFVMVMTVDLLFTFADLIINKGIPFFAVLQLLIYKLPSILILTFPVATLFGVTMAIGRMSHDSEIAALRTSGVSFFRIGLPFLVLALLVSIISFTTNELIVPEANRASEKIIRQIIRKSPLPNIQENVFFKDAYNRHFYIEKVDTQNNALTNIMIYELAGGEKLPRVITARTATLNDLKMRLNYGVIHKFDNEGRLEYEADFKEMTVNLEESPINIAYSKTSEEMDSQELKNKINLLEKGGVSARSLKTDLYMKYSVPLTCLVFALIGLPLSLPGIRGSRTWGVILTIVIMFTFYVFASVFRSLGRGAIMPPLLAAWMPQMLFGTLGILLIWKEG